MVQLETGQSTARITARSPLSRFMFVVRGNLKIDLTDRPIVGGAPVGIHLAQQFRRKGFRLHGSILPFFSLPGYRCHKMCASSSGVATPSRCDITRAV